MPFQELLSSVSQELLRQLSYMSRTAKSLFYLPIACLYTLRLRALPEYQDVWLLSERGDEARDNAYHLFKYIRGNHKGINVHYVIQKQSPDFDKVRKLGKAVEPNSFAHYALFLLSRNLVSTHFYGAQPWGKGSAFVLKILPRKKVVNLRHGVIKDKFNINDNNYDMVVCSSRSERKLLTVTSRTKLQLVGLCRYDRLVDESKRMEKKTILVMPTFRFWLEAASRLASRDEIFRKDSYFLCWDKFLRDERLDELCETEGCRIVFYPHNRSQKYIHNFCNYAKNVTIAKSDAFDVQSLLVQSSILVTDFSSVFFDFGYMRKPIVFFHFDEEKYRSLQYKQGGFSYRRDGFGPVFESADDIVHYIIERAQTDFRMEKEYECRAEYFFEFRDQDNTRRNLQAILELD